MLKKLLASFRFLSEYILANLKKFIAWRKYRMMRFRKLVWYKKLANIFFTFCWMFLLFLFCIDINFLWLFGKSPSMKAISNPPQSLASVVISADGHQIGKYFRENRMPVTFEEISLRLIETLIATEDERFYIHFGIDFHGLFAAAKDMLKGNPRGASTISQQLVKNMYKTRNQYSTGLFGYVPGVKLIIMKMKEWITAVKIELKYSKEDILTMYFNTVDFGSNAYGIKTAAKTYFKVKPIELNYEQSATLVGLLKATTTYNPIANPKRSLGRRNVVLQNLANKNVISQQVCDSLQKLPVRMDFSIEQTYEGEALHFRTYLDKYLNDWEKKSGFDIYSDGLKIHVTIDSRMQKYAEEAVRKHMKLHQQRFFTHWRGQNPWRDEDGNEIPGFAENIARKTSAYTSLKKKFGENSDSINFYLNLPRRTKVFDYTLGEKDTTLSIMDSIRYMNHFLHAGFVTMEPHTGRVKSWVGDIDFNFWKYDKVAQSKRQPGSTFKLFVYTAAMMHGLSPCDTRVDKPVRWEIDKDGEKQIWKPRNANRSYIGRVTLKHAFARSINSIAVQLAQETGIDEVIKYAHLLGIKNPLENSPSLSLGSSDVSLLEMVNSFGTVLNEGVYREPVLVTKIEDSKGNVVFRDPNMHKRVISYESAWLVTELLKGGFTEPGGTLQALWEWDLFRWNTDFGGKTGTSSNYSDAWFMGVTPKLIGGVWVGGEHRSVHFRSRHLGEGGRSALPVFGLFMEKLLADENFKHYRAKFPKEPKEKINRNYKCRTYVKRDTTEKDRVPLEPLPTPVSTIQTENTQ